MRILISGGGIAGMSAYIALKKEGHHLTLIEKRDSFEPKGAGIMLGINAMLKYQKLGLDRKVIDAGRVLKKISLQSVNGALMGGMDLELLEEKYDMPLVAIERSKLHAILESSLEMSDVFFETAVVDLIKNGELYSVLLSDGRRAEYDLVIVAEGIHSTTRQMLAGPIPYRFSGYSCWRMLLDCEMGDELVEMWGKGERFGIVPVKDNKSYVFLVKNALENDSRNRDLKPLEVKALFQKFSHKARVALDSIGETTELMYDDLVDQKILLFEKNGVIFIGDAAHAMTPNMGQGAGMGIEDAIVLSELITKDPRHFRHAYVEKRTKRVGAIHKASYDNGVVSQLENRWLVMLRDVLVKLIPVSLMTKQLEKQVIQPILE